MNQVYETEGIDVAGRIQKHRSTDLLTVSQVAEILNVHTNTVRRWSQLGILKSFRVGPRADRRFYYSDVLKLTRATDSIHLIDGASGATPKASLSSGS